MSGDRAEVDENHDEAARSGHDQGAGVAAGDQDEIARLVLIYAGVGDGNVVELTPEEEADLAEADAEVTRGEFATDDEMVAVFAKYRV